MTYIPNDPMQDAGLGVPTREPFPTHEVDTEDARSGSRMLAWVLAFAAAVGAVATVVALIKVALHVWGSQ